MILSNLITREIYYSGFKNECKDNILFYIYVSVLKLFFLNRYTFTFIGKILSFLGLILISGCVKTNEEFVERSLTAVFEVPANLNPVETHYLYVRNIPSLYAQTLSTRGWTNDQISRISPSRCRIYGRFGGVNLSIFSTISIRVISRDGKNTRSEMYFLEEIPLVGRSELDLRPTLSELKPILSQEIFDLEIRLQIRGFVPASLPLQLDFSYAAVLAQ